MNVFVTFDEKFYNYIEALKKHYVTEQTNGKIENEKQYFPTEQFKWGGCFPISQYLPPSNEYIFSIRGVLTIIQFCGFCLHFHTQKALFNISIQYSILYCV